MEKLYNYMMKNGYSEELYNKIEKEVSTMVAEDLDMLEAALNREESASDI